MALPLVLVKLREEAHGLGESVLHFVEQGFGGVGLLLAFARLDIVFGVKLFEELFFSAIQSLWNPNVHMDKLVASAIAVEVADALVSHTQNLARLSTRLDLQPCPSAESWDFNLSSKRRLGVTDQKLVDNVITVTREMLVRLLFDDHDQVASLPASAARVSLPAERNVVSTGDASRDIHLDRRLSLDSPLAPAGETMLLDDLPFAFTRRTCRDTHKLPKDGSRYMPAFA